MANKSKYYFSLLEAISSYVNENFIVDYNKGIELDTELFDNYFKLAIASLIGYDPNHVYSLELSTRGVWCLVVWNDNNPLLVVYPTSKFCPNEKIKFSKIVNVPLSVSEKTIIENAAAFKIISSCFSEYNPNELIGRFQNEKNQIFKCFIRRKNQFVEQSKYLEIYKSLLPMFICHMQCIKYKRNVVV